MRIGTRLTIVVLAFTLGGCTLATWPHPTRSLAERLDDWASCDEQSLAAAFDILTATIPEPHIVPPGFAYTGPGTYRAIGIGTDAAVLAATSAQYAALVRTIRLPLFRACMEARGYTPQGEVATR
jgi:hypothetical protein